MIRGGWSEWKESSCSSGCIEKSKGNVVKRRSCNNPTPVNTDKGCSGPSVEFGLCNDQKVNYPRANKAFEMRFSYNDKMRTIKIHINNNSS